MCLILSRQCIYMFQNHTTCPLQIKTYVFHLYLTCKNQTCPIYFKPQAHSFHLNPGANPNHSNMTHSHLTYQSNQITQPNKSPYKLSWTTPKHTTLSSTLVAKSRTRHLVPWIFDKVHQAFYVSPIKPLETIGYKSNRVSSFESIRNSSCKIRHTSQFQSSLTFNYTTLINNFSLTKITNQGKQKEVALEVQEPWTSFVPFGGHFGRYLSPSSTISLVSQQTFLILSILLFNTYKYQ